MQETSDDGVPMGRMSLSDPRALTLEILLSYEKTLKKLDSLIKDTLDLYIFLPVRDRAFIKKVAEGTVERLITLDYYIDLVSSVKTEKMKPVIRSILRMSAYQLLFMDHVPASAVINEAVKLTKLKHFGSLSGFVNAVLRNLIRNPLPLNSITDYSIRYSMPKWIVDRLLSEYGEGPALDILKASLERKKLFIRTNTEKCTAEELLQRLKAEGISAEKINPECLIDWLEANRPIANGAPALSYGQKSPAESNACLQYAVFDAALAIDPKCALNDIEAFREGFFSVQDLSSMAVGNLISPGEGEKILDLCAAPGGKATHAAELMHGTGYVEARDISNEKLGLINDNIERLGLSNIRAVLFNAECFNKADEEAWDTVICDLPCSGLGVMGRKNDLKYRLKSEDIGALVTLQRNILKNGVRYLKPGGKLSFSVCTILKEETVEQAAFIEEEYKLSKTAEKLFLPKEGGSDGFYVAVFRKELQ